MRAAVALIGNEDTALLFNMAGIPRKHIYVTTDKPNKEEIIEEIKRLTENNEIAIIVVCEYAAKLLPSEVLIGYNSLPVIVVL